ncbi:MAG TPA: cyclodeaminase/cyclohydrolase family protein [Anaerovoracaceae bacterium]|nr:cyclodeaminase/cyclohydrolase family protein [Anaerovoracaceae bacterium]
MGLLIDKTIKEFSDLLASREPAPGGGSTAALSGALAASLTVMVAELSFGKKSYEALEDGIKSRFRDESEEAERLRTVFLNLVDEDTKAFNVYMDALKMPAETEAERTKRAESMEQASLATLNVPLEVAENCVRILKNQHTVAEYGNKNAASDIGVGALLAFTGLEGAVLNVKINLPAISDEKIKRTALKRTAEYLREAEELKADIMRIVNSRM